MQWLILALGCAALDWIAVARADKKLEYLCKPATMVVVILAAWLWLPYAPNQWFAQFLLIGFAFSLSGDIFLMLPNPRYFLFGLAAFLCGHIAYILALNPTLPPLASLWLALPIALVGVWLMTNIVRALHASQQDALRAPVAIYGIAISVMLFSAWATLYRPEWSTAQRVCVIVGATLFFISDALLAWNRFVKPFATAELAVIITYHLGQIALALTLMV
jgi:uncharacterized membrane protein YhhN